MQKFDFNSKFEPFVKSVGELSKAQRLLICFGSIALIVVAFVFLLIKPNYEEIDKLKNKYSDLETKLVRMKQKASNLDRLEKEMKESEAEFKITMKALPDKKEIPSLLANISQSGQLTDLDFLKFQPKAEINKTFYSEIPVSILVNGDYQNFSIFFDKVSKLNRIVNIKNIKIYKNESKNKKKESDKLNMECMAVTYKFIEPPPTKNN